MESYRGMSFDVQIEQVAGRGFTVQAIIFEDSGDGLALRQVVGSPNAILKSREDARALSEALAREWIAANARSTHAGDPGA
jgi:hypothetical protein